MIKAKTRLC